MFNIHTHIVAGAGVGAITNVLARAPAAGVEARPVAGRREHALGGGRPQQLHVACGAVAARVALLREARAAAARVDHPRARVRERVPVAPPVAVPAALDLVLALADAGSGGGEDSGVAIVTRAAKRGGLGALGVVHGVHGRDTAGRGGEGGREGSEERHSIEGRSGRRKQTRCTA